MSNTPEPVTDTEMSSGDDTLVSKKKVGRPKGEVVWAEKKNDYMREYMRKYNAEKLANMTPEEQAESIQRRRENQARYRRKRGIPERPPKPQVPDKPPREKKPRVEKKPRAIPERKLNKIRNMAADLKDKMEKDAVIKNTVLSILQNI